jgi:hypothetical protein
VTFDPTTGTVNAAGVALIGSVSLKALSCVSTSECTAVSYVRGQEVTFDPRTAQVNAAGVATIGRPYSGFIAVSCPSSDQCSAEGLGDHPAELTFDPTTGTVNGAGMQKTGTGMPSPALDCPAANECVVVGNTGTEATFNPASGTGHATLIDRGGSLVSVSCPSAELCTAIDRGHEFTLHLRAGRVQVSRPWEIVGDFGLQTVSCASPTQCTTVDYKDHDELTFNPVTRRINRAGARSIDPTGTLTAVACPARTKCVAVDVQGGEVTFNPSTGKVLTGVKKLGIQPFWVSCSSASQCTTLDDQQEVTFNPRASGLKVLGRAPLYNRYGIAGINGLACPSLTECVVVAQFWEELAFRPVSGKPIAGGRKMLGRSVERGELNGVSCSSAHECIAVDGSGAAVSFNPTSLHQPARPTILGAAGFTAVSCTPTGRCIAVDDAGNAFAAAPRNGH